MIPEKSLVLRKNRKNRQIRKHQWEFIFLIRKFYIDTWPMMKSIRFRRMTSEKTLFPKWSKTDYLYTLIFLTVIGKTLVPFPAFGKPMPICWTISRPLICMIPIGLYIPVISHY